MSNSNFQKLTANLLSFIGLGIFIVLAILCLFIFSYLFLIGAIVGFILFAIAYIRGKIIQHRRKQNPEAHGRIIEGEFEEKEPKHLDDPQDKS